MLTSLSIKTLFRTPLKTLITILLLAATSYMLFFSVAEFVAMSRERERAVDFYQGVGAVEAEPVQAYYPDDSWYSIYMADQPQIPVYSTDFYLYADERVTYNPYGDEIRKNHHAEISRDNIDAIASLPYISDTSIRYMTSGVSGHLYRADDRNDYFSYTARFVAEGFWEKSGYYLTTGFSMQPSKQGAYSSQKMIFLNLTTIAGSRLLHVAYDGVRNKDRYALVYAYELSSDNTDGRVIPLSSTERLFSVIQMGESYYDDVYNYTHLGELANGEHYVIVGRSESGSMLTLSDPATLNAYPQIYSLKGQPENYLELDEFAPLRELIQITNDDAHTFDVVYTDDMSSIMRFAEGDMVISKGRMLTDEDSNSNVCVMNDMYMAHYGLKIGDKVSLKLGDKLFEQNAAIGAIAYVRERYPDTFTEEIEFEIVGAYRDVDSDTQQAMNLHWAYSGSTIFVPLSFLPVEVPDGHVIRPGEFSFTIDDPRNISAFLTEVRPIIEDTLGLTLIFTDGGWSALESQIDRAISLAAVRLLLLFFCTVVAIILTVYLFIGRKRKEYAVMRALGTPFARANRSLYIPLACLAVFALAAGNIMGYVFIGDRIEKVLAPFAQAGLETSSTIPVYLIPVCFVCVFAALALITAYMLYRVGKKPPLELLQMGINRANTRITQAVATAPAATAVRTDTPAQSAPAASATEHTARGYSAARHVGAYVVHHIARTRVKSLFSFGLALLLVGAIGQLTVIRGVYQDSYDNLDVKAYINEAFRLRFALSMAESDYVESVYYENIIESLDCYKVTPKLVMTNNIDRFSGGAAEIVFLDGYDYSSMCKIDAPRGPVNKICVMDSGLMQALGVQLGDTVRLHNRDLQFALINAQFGVLMTGSGASWDRMCEAVDADLDKLSLFFTVVGEIVSGSAPDTIIIPATRAVLEKYVPDAVALNYTEFTLVSPQDADAFRKFAESKIDSAVGDLGSPLVMDTGEADNILRALGLLNTLYPIVIAAAVIMSGLFPGLVVMQSDREASIMRVLGTTKTRTRILLITEQIALCILGMLCAAALLLAINGASVADHIRALGLAALALLAGCIAGASVCAVIITRRRILELLQVKE